MTAGAHNPATPAGGTPPRFRVALEFALGGDLRYLAHHDEMRFLARALVRAGWPLAYSRGFNPRPRLTIPLPRNLGIEAATQLAVVDLTAPRTAADLAQRLAPQMPGGCRLLRVIAPAPRATPHPRSAVYELALAAGEGNGLAERSAQVLTAPTVIVNRESAPGRPTRPFDIRPYIEELDWDGAHLRMRLAFVEQRTARPSEAIGQLGLAVETFHHRIRRAEVLWDMEIAEAVCSATNERNAFVSEEDDYEESGEDAA
jgi:radical SAM-linked protein